MQASKPQLWIAFIGILLFSSLGPATCYDLVDVEEMLTEAEDFGRSLLQTAGTAGGYGGYGTAGGYGGYGGYGPRVSETAAAAPRVRTRTVCSNQTNPTTLQVFVAMMQPSRPLSNAEVAQDAPSGMMTMYVDPRTGQAWVSGDISNVQNMTAVTLNAGNVTENGPVVLPLIPNTASVDVNGNRTTVGNLSRNETLIRALWNSTFNNTGGNAGAGGAAGANTSQTPTVAVPTFQPALPWLAHMQFSQKVFMNATLPLLANATVNNTATGGGNATNSSTGNASPSAAGSADLSIAVVGPKPNRWVNITKIIQTLGSGNATVTTITKFSTNGSTSTVNITSPNNTQSNAAGGGANASTFNASDYNTTNMLALLQAGMAYVSVWTTQSGNDSEMRGQMMPLGNVVGASPAISTSFPDALVPNPSYTTSVCRNVTEPVPQAGAVPGGTGRESGMRNVTTDVYGADVVGNNYTARAQKVLPAVANAMTNITSGNNTNMKGNYSIFAAAVNAAAGLVGNASSQGGAAGANAAGTGAGRRLLQGGAGAGAGGNAGGRNPQAALNGTAGTGGITVFAPSNQAIAAFLKTVNLTQQQFLANKTLLLKVISFHIIATEALSAVDLAKQGNIHQLKTLLPFNNIGYKLDRAGNATLYGVEGAGPHSAARIVDANMRSGKVIVQGVDAVLMPPSLRSLVANKTMGAAGGNMGAMGAGAGNTTAGGAGAKNQGAGRRLMKLLHLV